MILQMTLSLLHKPANFTALDIHCDCEVACSSFIYNTRISSAYWPALHVEPGLEKDFNITEEYARYVTLNFLTF